MAVSDFQREYAVARRKYLAGQGPATFTFNNKSYSVASKEESDTAKFLKRAAVDESGRYRSRRADDDSMRYRGQRSYVASPEEPKGPTPEQRARYEEMSRLGRDAIEPIMPEAALLGLPSVVRGMAGMARGAMLKAAAKKALPSRRTDPAEFSERAPRDLVSEANRRMRAESTDSGFKKGGVVKSRGNGCARKGFGKGTMR